MKLAWVEDVWMRLVSCGFTDQEAAEKIERTDPEAFEAYLAWQVDELLLYLSDDWEWDDGPWSAPA